MPNCGSIRSLGRERQQRSHNGTSEHQTIVHTGYTADRQLDLAVFLLQDQIDTCYCIIMPLIYRTEWVVARALLQVRTRLYTRHGNIPGTTNFVFILLGPDEHCGCPEGDEQQNGK